ncbi:21433_t:CDS:1, partial [Racocetra persica]
MHNDNDDIYDLLLDRIDILSCKSPDFDPNMKISRIEYQSFKILH